ncbi:MAG TPA: three-Cys-motif partner protein TcmP [Gemmatimonadaceae bacterium]|nr:three-Cys-motif partner protein TcmP [Gemmatimonadaceae bacterium]
MPARRSGAWARDKLSFFDEFLPPALQATKDKVHRHYVDLFAGPGRNIDDEGAEFDGGAVRALKARAQSSPDVRFTHAHLVNLDRIAHDALRQRVDARCEDGSCAIPASAVQFDNDDANLLVGAIMRRIHKRAYAFIFADIEAPNQLPYDTVRALKFHGHESVDFCVLFPQGMALQRMLPMRRDKLAPTIEALNRYFGTDAWLELYDQRKTDAQSPELYRGIQKLYEDQLRKAGWMYAKEIRNVKRRGDAALYKILLATDKDVALRLASWSVEKERDRKGPELELGL